MNLSCSDCAQSSSVKCSSTPPGEEPALLTRMSMRPKAACAFLMKFSASEGLVRSAGMAKILAPVALAISAAVASSGSLRRAQIATSTPSRAKANVIALPMPSLAPGTIAFFPVIARSIAAPPLYRAAAARATRPLSSRFALIATWRRTKPRRCDQRTKFQSQAAVSAVLNDALTTLRPKYTRRRPGRTDSNAAARHGSRVPRGKPMNRNRFGISFILLAGIAGAASAEDGVTDKSIVFVQVAALTGPAQDLGQGMRQGILAAFEDANRGGGVLGRTLALKSRDDGYEPEKTVEATKASLAEDKVFALIGAVGTPSSKATQPIATAAKVPFIGPFTGAEFLRNPYNRYVVN